MPEITSKYPTVSALYEGQNREANKNNRFCEIGWSNNFSANLYGNSIYIQNLQSTIIINVIDSF